MLLSQSAPVTAQPEAGLHCLGHVRWGGQPGAEQGLDERRKSVRAM